MDYLEIRYAYDSLSHSGVKGMKWGVRNDNKKVLQSKPDQKTAEKYKKMLQSKPDKKTAEKNKKYVEEYVAKQKDASKAYNANKLKSVALLSCGALAIFGLDAAFHWFIHI